MNLCFVFCHRQLSSIHENSQTEGVGNEVRQRASKDLANNLNLAMVTIYTFLLFFCCFGCYKGENPGNALVHNLVDFPLLRLVKSMVQGFLVELLGADHAPGVLIKIR
jgi:hypothetical protein